MADNRPRVVVTDYDCEHLDEVRQVLDPLDVEPSIHQSRSEADVIEVAPLLRGEPLRIR